MVARTKKKKNKSVSKNDTVFNVIRVCNYLNVATMVRTLNTVYDWNKEQLEEFLESHMALLSEVADHRNGIKNFVAETEEMTGINITELIDRTYSSESQG